MAIGKTEMARKKHAINAYDLVQVEWEDSCRPISHWQWIEDYAIPKIVRCLSVGFLVAQTDNAIALAPNLGDFESDRIQASGIIRIPRSAIRKTEKL